MTLDELTVEMARELLADPDDVVVSVWVDGFQWGWRRGSADAQAVPQTAAVLAVDRLMGGDADATQDEQALVAYAADLRSWLLQLVAWPVSAYCNECKVDRTLQAGDGIVACSECGYGLVPLDRWWEVLPPQQISRAGWLDL